ncbi:MAG: chromate transporter [Clostridia bacterium]|nr:chromate transporter [Clostridia bacterium]
MILLQLFWAFFQVGLFSIGGGYAALPSIQQQVVNVNGWLTMEQFTDVITISEMTPGPIAINASTFVGTQVAGLPGSIVATIGCITAPVMIVLVLAYLYYRFRKLAAVQGILSGQRPAVVGLIGAAGLSIIATALWNGTLFNFSFAALNPAAIVLFAIALFVMIRWKPNPIIVLVASGIVGLAVYGLFPALL